jgi:hypothetical protein
MRQKTKYIVDVKELLLQQTDISVLGVVSICIDFTFVARVNRFTKYNFYKGEDFALWKKNKKDYDKFTSYYYNYKEKGCRIIIVNTKNANNDTFINNWKDYNNIIIIVGRDNKIVAEEILKNIKKETSIAEILSLEEEYVLETVNSVAQMDMFGQVQNITTSKQKKCGISLENLDNFFIAVEDYLTIVDKYGK